ncbi:MAG: hypothetical protein HUJ25_13375 [Crocinitomicaceae bacterium]|nr:hypothetical protein [Crocinitomicaceae bacterium]
MSKININNIIVEHFKSQFTTGFDYFIFMLIPALLTTLLVWFEISLKFQAGIIISSLSIFIGLFINVLVLLFDIIRRYTDRSIKIEVLKQVMANISFTVLLSGIAIICLFLTKIHHELSSKIFNGITIYLLAWIMLNILMILKRIYVLFLDEINQGK